MLFASKYSKMSIEERVTLFKNLSASQVKSYINRRDLDGYHEQDLGQRTPLSFAVSLSDINVVIELIKMGSNAFHRVNRFANPAICDAIGANRPLSDIKLIAKHSKSKVNWDAESIGAYSCQIAASSRSDSKMLEFLYEQGVNLKKTHKSELATFSTYSNAIVNGPAENVEFLHSIGCEYPPKLRRFFHFIFTSDMSRDHREPWKKNTSENLEHQLSSDRWKKIKFLVERRVIEPHYLREQMHNAKIDPVFQEKFWLNIDKEVTEHTVKFISKNVLTELRAVEGLQVEVVEELRDERRGHVYGHVLKIQQKWLLDLQNAAAKNRPPVSNHPEQIAGVHEADDIFYGKALNELETGNEQKDTYAKALTLSKGDKEQAKWRYVELRVSALKLGN